MDLQQYIEILLIPALMLCDYYLTLVGNKSRFEGHSHHFVVNNYELNPIWVKDVNKHKLLNLRHLFLVLLTGLFIFYLNYTENHSVFYKLLYGALLMNFVLINSRHISNILLFKYIRNNPNEIQGQVTLSERYVYNQSAIQYVGCAIILAPLAILSGSYYVYGALAGCLFIAVIQKYWLRKKKKKEEKLSDGSAGDGQGRATMKN